jgi:putative long chain acyl-CoA synthase
VLLRPDGDLRREAALGRITWVISDPERTERADDLDGVTWAVLGGGAADRDLGPKVIDMERIDASAVEVPAWYRANPHRAGDVAFVLFTGEGRSLRAVTITNRRWALSALGTAAAATLRPGDTVYSTTPIHHSSALLMSVGGAIAGGARFAMGSADDPAVFWEEVRRYGATHVSYTWTSLRAVAMAPPNPAERHHPVRLFMGSGMPRNLWRRVAERFPTARVLEFYASAEGEAILANVKGTPVGSVGRPLPGTAEVRIAAFDRRARTVRLAEDGLACECDVDEVGLLLARVDPADSMTGTVLRGVFEPGDAWRSTEDLFLRDEHDDLWYVDPVSAIVETDRGAILPAGARASLNAIPAVDMQVSYGVPVDGHEVLVSSVTVCSGAQLTSSELDRAFDRLPQKHRPAYIQVVDAIPVTTWHRPVWTSLQRAGVPEPGHGRPAWRLDPDTGHYVDL